jgi:hypothetical protein
MAATIISRFTYPNSDFTSLGGNPINNSVLAQEIEDDATITLPVASVVSLGTDTQIELLGNATAAMKTALDTLVADHEGGSFAIFPQSSSDDSETNEGDTGTETTKVTHSTGLMPAGTYLVTWYMEVRLDTDGGSAAGVVARLKVEGTERAQTATEKAQYVHFSGSKRLTVVDGQEYDIDLTYQRSGAGYTAYAQRASIDIMRIG